MYFSQKTILCYTLIFNIITAVLYSAEENSVVWNNYDVESRLSSESKYITAKFTCKNLQKNAIDLSVLKVSCGCISVSPKNLRIPYGETATLDATIDVRLVTKTETKYILLKSSDSRRPLIRLSVKIYPYQN